MQECDGEPLIVLLVTKLDTSPPSLCTSFTRLDEIKDFWSDVIRKIVSI